MTGPRGVAEESQVVIRRFAELGPTRKVLYCRAVAIPKVQYPNVTAAQNAARELGMLRGWAFTPYPCPHDDHYHLTKLR